MIHENKKWCKYHEFNWKSQANTFHEKLIVTYIAPSNFTNKSSFWIDPNLYKILNLGQYVFKKLNFLDWPNFVQNAQSRAMLLQKGNTFHEKVTSLLQIPCKKLDSWNDPNLYKMLNLGHYVFKKLNLLDWPKFVQNAQSRAMLL